MRVLESAIEASIVARVAKLWPECIALKLNGGGRRGFPDRLFLFPRGRAVFVEVKRPGETARRLQDHVHGTLRDLGYAVGVFDNVDGAIEWISEHAS